MKKQSIMKHTISHIFAILTLMIFFVGCGEAEKEIFDDKDAFFAFESDASVVNENRSEVLKIPVCLSRTVAGGELSFDIVNEGFENPAIEGEDFNVLNSNSTVSFADGLVQNIEIELIDNEEIDKDKQFKIVLASNTIGANLGLANNTSTEFMVTIIDDEHPLAPILGGITLHWNSPWNGNDMYRLNSIFSVEDSDTEVDIALGWYRDNEDFAKATHVRGIINPDDNTISIAYGQVTYDDGTHILTLVGDDETPGGIIEEGNLIGDIDWETGTITFRNPFAIIFSGGPNTGYYQDLYISPVLSKN